MATESHPFWVEGRGWVAAGRLQAGDILRSSTGRGAMVEGVASEGIDSPPARVYNFEVEDWHTYYVSAAEALVHNSCSNSGVKVSFNGNKVPVYRGGNDFTIKPGDIRIDAATGLVKTEHGVSLNVRPDKVVQHGGAYRIDYLPNELKIIQRGINNPLHFEVVPKAPMPVSDFQSLLNQIICTPIP